MHNPTTDTDCNASVVKVERLSYSANPSSLTKCGYNCNTLLTSYFITILVMSCK